MKKLLAIALVAGAVVAGSASPSGAVSENGTQNQIDCSLYTLQHVTAAYRAGEIRTDQYFHGLGTWLADCRNY